MRARLERLVRPVVIDVLAFSSRRPELAPERQADALLTWGQPSNFFVEDDFREEAEESGEPTRFKFDSAVPMVFREFDSGIVDVFGYPWRFREAESFAYSSSAFQLLLDSMTKIEFEGPDILGELKRELRKGGTVRDERVFQVDSSLDPNRKPKCLWVFNLTIPDHFRPSEADGESA
jgi:hypothetical protein